MRESACRRGRVRRDAQRRGIACRSRAEDLQRIGRDDGLAGLTLAELQGVAERDVAVGADLAGRQGAGLRHRGRRQAEHGSRDQEETRRYAYRDPVAFAAIVDSIVAMTIEYLAQQIAHGVEAVQLFDSWAGSLSPEQFERWVIAPNRAIVDGLRARCPGVPIIGFPKGAGGKLAAYAAGTTVDAIGLDETVDPRWADAVLPPGMPVQGNLDPLALLTGGEALDRGIDRVLAAFPERPHVFNLGHGIGQHTPIAHVERLLARVRSQ